ncbi:MAG: DUF2059 domain-containing protein [Desulfomonilaceae bacterium]
MRIIRLAISAIEISIIVVISQSLSFAQIQSSDSAKLIRMSGLRGQIQRLPDAILMTVPSDLFPDNRSRFDFNNYIKSEINTESMVKLLQETLSENLNPDKLEKLIKFYESSLGQKIGRIQADVLSMYNIKSIREARGITTTLGPNRAKLIDRLINNQRIYQNNFAFRKLIISLLSQTNWNEEFKSGNNKLTTSDFKEKSFEKDADSLRQATLTCFTYTYRSLTDLELESFAEFQETQAGECFEIAVTRGFKQVIIMIINALDHGLRNLKARSPRN